MAKKTVQSSAVEEFKGYIKVTDGFYLKPVESHASSYDVYQLKKSDSPRHPNGKMDDMAYGCTLPRALQLIANKCAGQEAEDIIELMESIKSYEQKFLEDVTRIVKETDNYQHFKNLVLCH